jgi:hypothetical protein
LFCSRLLAQYENASLLVQSPDGKTVKLVWFLKSWDKRISGFDIKRKDGIKDWVKLNKEPILPEISIDKNLAVVEPDEHEQSAIKNNFFKLVDNNKLEVADEVSFLKKLNNNDKTLRDLMDMTAHDYNLALMTGFAYVDRSVTQKQDYEYGVFIQGSDILLDSVLWNYGQIPDLNTVENITSKADKINKGIEVIWNANLNKMKAGDVAGFNIYREGIRLNATPIVSANSNDATEFTWFDQKANSGIPNHYSISAESIFGIEGIIKSYTYNPAGHPDKYQMPEVTDIVSQGYYFKEGINIKWNFPKESEHFIKGFYVEKNNIPGVYTKVSSLLDPSARTFVDKTSSPVNGYISSRVIAIYNDKTAITGTEKIYNYFPMREPPQPQNVKVAGVLKDKVYNISFSWDPPMSGDTITDYYSIYSCNTTNYKLDLITPQPVRGHSFIYQVRKGSAAVYKFCISATGKNKTEGRLSDTVAVKAPSLGMPPPVINKVSVDSNKIIVKWQYSELSDLKGFRLYQNGSQIASENELKKNTREFRTVPLSGGANYDFTILAVSENDILSEASLPVGIVTPLPHKK